MQPGSDWRRVEAPIMTLEQLRVFGEVAVGRVSRSITKPRRVA